MAKQYKACNWAVSRVTETQLQNAVMTGALAPKSEIHWRVPAPECPPKPQAGEVIVFFQHLGRGFSPPGSKFFRDVLARFQLHPQDIGPNSITNLCDFQVFCKVYLQEEPTVDLFQDLFHLNRRSHWNSSVRFNLSFTPLIEHFRFIIVKHIYTVNRPFFLLQNLI